MLVPLHSKDSRVYFRIISSQYMLECQRVCCGGKKPHIEHFFKVLSVSLTFSLTCSRLIFHLSCSPSVCSEVITEERATPEPEDPDEIEVNVNYEPDPTDLVLSSVPGGELFDPRKHKFSEEELKPQPMIKKAKKVFVPEEQKVCRERDNNISSLFHCVKYMGKDSAGRQHLELHSQVFYHNVFYICKHLLVLFSGIPQNG